MARIVFIGAGSTVFARNLMGDILSFPELSSSTIVLHDINEERLRTSEIVGHKIIETLGVTAKIEATTDRRAALDGANYVITMFQVGGYKPSTVIDFEIPKKYGLEQTIADTLGVGGIMRGLRTIPVILDICRDMEELCPDALLLNYVNPMSMLCWAISRSSTIKTIGLCHSVQHTAHQLADDLGIDADTVEFRCAGINHMAFYLDFQQRQGKDLVDLYPRIAERAEIFPMPTRGDVERSDGGFDGLSDAVRYEMFKRLGYFVTESSEHFSEYVPWFIKSGRADLLDKFGIPLDEYPRRCERQIEGWETLRTRLENPEARVRVVQSMEYGSGIIHSMETGQSRVVYGNVPNRGIISNLPDDCCVEVPCVVDATGITPTHIGALPPHLAALMQTNINVQSLTVEAALTGKREHVYHAAMFDPHTAAELDLDQIWALVDELLAAHRGMVPEALFS
ncbi:MAG: alpha-glucosidase/alpha-galactosidase [Ilumatobacteraceae bacterium]|jgi:alpha-galactosidase|nr:alpha-glucosidase/alpha-galactosidase [Ilumatobacteraceae bacterium]